MPRRGKYTKHQAPPDFRYGNPQLQRFINKVMLSGKKPAAEKIVYGALDAAAERLGRSQIEVFETALRNVAPTIKVTPKRVGGATYQVPMEVRSDRGTTLALRWLIRFSRQRAGRTMASKLANELMDAANETGNAIRKREETHRMADANKAFAHYRY